MLIAKTSLLLLTLALLAPPSGRPPVGPLARFEPKLYDLSFEVLVATARQPRPVDRQDYDLTDAPIAMPLIHMSTFSRMQPDSVTGKLWLTAAEQDPHLTIKDGYPFNTHLAIMTIDRFRGKSLRWQVGYRVQVWSSRIDDEAAARIAWPKEWPAEVQDGLKPQMFIESDDPIFKETVERVSGGQLRMVPPYLAAKDLIRYAINELQTSGDGVDYGANGVIRGIEVTGARQAATSRIGTPHDLVCVCVAMLRAAGIPARPVIGVQENEKDGKNEFASWAEFYLPDCGWIPFDPNVMRGKGVRGLDVHKAWPEFGTMDKLNQRIPLSFHFIPAATVESPQNAAVWGWDPRPARAPSSEQAISIVIVSRGKGEEDPQ